MQAQHLILFDEDCQTSMGTGNQTRDKGQQPFDSLTLLTLLYTLISIGFWYMGLKPPGTPPRSVFHRITRAVIYHQNRLGARVSLRLASFYSLAIFCDLSAI